MGENDGRKLDHLEAGGQPGPQRQLPGGLDERPPRAGGLQTGKAAPVHEHLEPGPAAGHVPQRGGLARARTGPRSPGTHPPT